MKKKSLIMLVCALVIVSSVAFGTIAYLTDRAGVVNKFTLGNVDIVVDETEVDEEGAPVPDPEYDPDDPDPEHPDPNKRTEEENEYPLIPDSEYVKDPTMTVRAGSKEAYVRMVVTITGAAEVKAIFDELKILYPLTYPNGFVPGDFVTGRDNTKWVYVEDEDYGYNAVTNTYTLEFRYFEPVEPTDGEDVVLEPLFETIRFPGELTNAQLSTLENFEVWVDGHAIQTTGFTTADKAWTAYDAQMSVMPIAPAPGVVADTTEQ